MWHKPTQFPVRFYKIEKWGSPPLQHNSVDEFLGDFLKGFENRRFSYSIQ